MQGLVFDLKDVVWVLFVVCGATATLLKVLKLFGEEYLDFVSWYRSFRERLRHP